MLKRWQQHRQQPHPRQDAPRAQWQAIDHFAPTEHFNRQREKLLAASLLGFVLVYTAFIVVVVMHTENPDHRNAELTRENIEYVTRSATGPEWCDSNHSKKRRVVHGDCVDLAEFPSLVFLLFKDIRNGTVTHMCTGFFVARGWVATGAHCWPLVPYEYTVAYALYDCVDLSDPQCSQQQVLFFFRHPCQSSTGGRYDSVDVMLALLADQDAGTPLQLASVSKRVGSNVTVRVHAPLSSAVSEMGVVREIWGVGFGIMNPKFERRFLLAVQQRFLPPTSAKNAFSYAASRYPPLAVEPLGLESYMCDGDSGSPLVAELMDGRRVALGVASSVYMDPAHAADKSRSCTEGALAYYVDTAIYVEWMHDVMKGKYDRTCKTYSGA